VNRRVIGRRNPGLFLRGNSPTQVIGESATRKPLFQRRLGRFTHSIEKPPLKPRGLRSPATGLSGSQRQTMARAQDKPGRAKGL
jgi:hypothetical protein